MDIERIVQMLHQRGLHPGPHSNSQHWDNVLRGDIKDYLRSCITEDGYQASDIGVLGDAAMVEENAIGVSPGGVLREYGYLAIAISAGGNGIVVSCDDNCVYWADHSYFSDSVEINYENKESHEWKYVPWNATNVRAALVLLSRSFELFMVELLQDIWQSRLDAMD